MVKVGSKKVVKKKAVKSAPAEEKLGVDGLTTKQRLFVEYYLANGFNATEAARAAGYKGEAGTLAVVGFENLRKPNIAAAVAVRIDEAAMPANEVMARLTAIGRGDLADFLNEDGKFDLPQARKAKKTGLLKKLKRKTTSKRVDARTEGDEGEAETIETSLVYEEVEFELHSVLDALKELLKYHGLAGTVGLNLNLTPEQLAGMSDEEIDALIFKLSRRR